MSKNIIFACEENADEKFDLILPTFVLCLRDFILDSEKDGQVLTADEYLEDCLQLKPMPPNGKKDVEKYNRPRECIRKYFPKRKCFTFDRPGYKSDMKRLETAKADELFDDFLKETEQFLSYVYNCKPKVLLSSKPVRGKMFVTLATSYIKAISNGAVPDVDDAFQTVAKIENERMAIEAVKDFSVRVQDIELPVLHIHEFDKIYGDIQNASLAHFRSEALFESEQFEKEALVKMENIWNLTKKQNCELVRNYCLTQLKKIFGDVVGEKKAKEIYFAAGGYEEYKCDIGKVKNTYNLKMQGIDEYEFTRVLNEFFEGEADYESKVMMKDKKFAEENRKKKDFLSALGSQMRLVGILSTQLQCKQSARLHSPEDNGGVVVTGK
ncbi:guanylate-binding protein 2-like [Mercenaria mercenaria]|uniref:guanylate-binding protein 2-like n=1 Tax=Mercenaria mercenaria TaxID=6596 RepID=UPI00234E68C4|nr:guanylate-binding protein 2-like [Mercenaria mercenaria]